MKKLFLGAISFIPLALLPLTASAISDHDPVAFTKSYEDQINPFFKTGSLQYFPGVDKKQIAYMTFRVNNEKGAVVIVPGRTEPLEKYREVIFDVASRGYSVYILDHRGQGYSDRLLNNLEISHVRHFTDYVSDLKYFVEKIVNPENKKTHQREHNKVYLFGHSMGGAIATYYLQKENPKIDGAVFSSPMYEMNLGKYSRLQADALLVEAWVLGKMDEYVPDGKGYDWSETIDTTNTTHSPLRFAVNHQLIKDKPKLALGSPSYRWVGTSLFAEDEIEREAGETHYPILILEAGDDQIVQPRGEEKFLSNAPDCKILRFPKARHEILQEKDEFREPAMEAALQFFESH